MTVKTMELEVPIKPTAITTKKKSIHIVQLNSVIIKFMNYSVINYKKTVIMKIKNILFLYNRERIIF